MADMIFLKTTKQNDVINNRGFSLIELLISLVIISIVSVAVYGVFYLASRSYTTQSVSADVQQSIRAATEVIMQDIRTAGLDPTSSGNFGIELAENIKLRFTSDSIGTSGDFNGILEDINSERVTYVLQGTQLNQILYETTDSEISYPLISGVKNLTFTYFDSAGNDLGSPVPSLQLGDIRSVTIAITVQEPAGRDEPVSRMLTKSVKCRNIGL